MTKAQHSTGGESPRRGVCRRCGQKRLLGERWRGRVSTAVPALWCAECERAYPVLWTAEQVDDAVQQTTAFAYWRAARPHSTKKGAVA